MFSNSGRKIKIWAWFIFGFIIFTFLVGAILCFITAANYSHSGYRWMLEYQSQFMTYGVVLLVLSFPIAWGTALKIYGFGQLVQDVEQIKKTIVPNNASFYKYPKEYGNMTQFTGYQNNVPQSNVPLNGYKNQ